MTNKQTGWIFAKMKELEGELERLSKGVSSKEMYRIREKDHKKIVVCDNCHKNGEVDPHCSKCGGKGVHRKGYSQWEVHPYTIEIDKIDRDSKTGELRYWTDMSCFYNESDKLIHFTLKDAQKECERRNRAAEELAMTIKNLAFVIGTDIGSQV